MNTNTIKIKMFLTKLLTAVVYITIGSAVTLGTVTYLWLKADNARLEGERDQLVIEKSVLLMDLEEAEANLGLELVK